MNALILHPQQTLSIPERVETVDVSIAMKGLSEHTQHAYSRWIIRFLVDVNRLGDHRLALGDVPVNLIQSSLGPAALRVWLGLLKADNLGKQSLGQAKAS